jgi:hypothetical protein
MKEYEAVIYADGVKKVRTIMAPTRADAQRLAWEMFDADDIYIAEVYNDDGSC